MNHYLLLLRNEAIDFSAYSPEEVEQIIAEFDRWNASMGEHLLFSANLKGGGRALRAGAVITDGPYSEAKEAVAGVLLIAADGDDEAAAMASGCPFLSRGGSVEVRGVPHLEFEDSAQQLMDEHVAARRAKAEAGAAV